MWIIFENILSDHYVWKKLHVRFKGCTPFGSMLYVFQSHMALCTRQSLEVNVHMMNEAVAKKQL